MSDKTAPWPKCCHTRGCGLDALDPFIVCYEHVTKDALMLYVQDLRTALRRLAAPPLPPGAVAVLEAAEAFDKAHYGEAEPEIVFAEAVGSWIAAGRPGLPPRAGAGREEK
jgi:hypothetical protein